MYLFRAWTCLGTLKSVPCCHTRNRNLVQYSTDIWQTFLEDEKFVYSDTRSEWQKDGMVFYFESSYLMRCMPQIQKTSNSCLIMHSSLTLKLLSILSKLFHFRAVFCFVDVYSPSRFDRPCPWKDVLLWWTCCFHCIYSNWWIFKPWEVLWLVAFAEIHVALSMFLSRFALQVELVSVPLQL